MKTKVLLFMCVLILICFGSLAVAADTPEEFQDTVQTWVATGMDAPRVNYTYDSVRTSGISAEPFADALTQTVGIQIYTNLDLGIRIYDDPDTEEIDGIRVNGKTVTSLKAVLDELPSEVVIDVRLDYREGLVGDLARMSDGTYDWTKILANPLALFAVLYYLIASAVLLISSITAATSRKKKIKNANEIAQAVDSRAQETDAYLLETVNDFLDNQIAPIMNTFVGVSQQLVKAMTLTAFKSKDAPIALLDTLQSVATVDVNGLIEQAKQSVLEADKKAAEHRANTLNLLNTIATANYREGLTDVTQNTEGETKEQTQKSVF